MPVGNHLENESVICRSAAVNTEYRAEGCTGAVGVIPTVEIKQHMMRFLQLFIATTTVKSYHPYLKKSTGKIKKYH